ncbi:MAG: type II secretion system protein [Planctomycetota bacterium]|jgi:prepilin-type N-terminal cleavage/methylation domain-containing protein/prepilin-type processing-associated H-X9-DG protein
MFNFKTRTAFTLIELLVVISIIALLMAILMPTLARAKELAAEVVCMSNLKQWGIAYSMYTSDHNGQLPRQGFITEKNYFENDNLLFCPLATKEFDQGGRNPFAAWRGGGNSEAKITGSLGVNNWACSRTEQNSTSGFFATLGDYKDACWLTADQKGSERIPMVFDCAYIYVCPFYSDAPPAFNGEIPTIIHFGGWGHNPDALKGACIDRHNGYINMLFVDYSVRKVTLKELWYLRWHKRWDQSLQGQSPPVWPHWMRNFKDYSK